MCYIEAANKCATDEAGENKLGQPHYFWDSYTRLNFNSEHTSVIVSCFRMEVKSCDQGVLQSADGRGLTNVCSGHNGFATEIL